MFFLWLVPRWILYLVNIHLRFRRISSIGSKYCDCMVAGMDAFSSKVEFGTDKPVHYENHVFSLIAVCTISHRMYNWDLFDWSSCREYWPLPAPDQGWHIPLKITEIAKPKSIGLRLPRLTVTNADRQALEYDIYYEVFLSTYLVRPYHTPRSDVVTWASNESIVSCLLLIRLVVIRFGVWANVFILEIGTDIISISFYIWDTYLLQINCRARHFKFPGSIPLDANETCKLCV